MSPSKRSTSYPYSALFLLLTAFIILLSACRPGDLSSEAGATGGMVRKTSRLVILHTNDTWGYYDPCG
jgi:hypothetical protein